MTPKTRNTNLLNQEDSFGQVKRRAKVLGKQMEIPHHEALDIAAREWGAMNWKHLTENVKKFLTEKPIEFKDWEAAALHTGMKTQFTRQLGGVPLWAEKIVFEPPKQVLVIGPQFTASVKIPFKVGDNLWVKEPIMGVKKKVPERVVIEIVHINIRRLHDLTLDDCLQEGITGRVPVFLEYREKWGSEIWESNPWVVTHIFKQVEK